MPVHANPFAMPPVPPRRAQGLHRGQKAALYLAGSTALRDIMQVLGLTAYKAGISGRRDIDWRIRDLCQRRYASILAPKEARDRTIMELETGDEWFLSPLREPDAAERAMIATLAGGAYSSGVIEFRVPAGLTIPELEGRVREILTERNLNSYLATEDGAERLRDTGLPATARLFTDYDLVGRARRLLATELFCVRPNQELAILIEAVRQALGVQ